MFSLDHAQNSAYLYQMLNHVTRPSRLTLHTIKTDIFTLLHLVEVLIEILHLVLSVLCLPGWLCDALVCEALGYVLDRILSQ